MESKNKYIGFRLTYADYMSTIETAGRLNVSVSDFILSVLLPAINKDEAKLVHQEVPTMIKLPLQKEQNITPTKSTVHTDNTLELLIQKEKTYQQKLKSI